MKTEEEIWHERQAEDKEHELPRPGHKLAQQTGMPCGIQSIRTVCECGWRGEWVKVTAAAWERSSAWANITD